MGITTVYCVQHDKLVLKSKIFSKSVDKQRVLCYNIITVEKQIIILLFIIKNPFSPKDHRLGNGGLSFCPNYNKKLMSKFCTFAASCRRRTWTTVGLTSPAGEIIIMTQFKSQQLLLCISAKFPRGSCEAITMNTSNDVPCILPNGKMPVLRTEGSIHNFFTKTLTNHKSRAII